MDSQVESLKKRLEELEKREQIWREQQRDKERRAKEDFERQIAQIEEDFAIAVERLELEFSAKKKALLNLHSAKDGHGKTVAAAPPVPCNGSAQQVACTNGPGFNTSVSTKYMVAHQIKKLPGISTDSRNHVAVRKHVTREVIQKVTVNNSRLRRWQHRTFVGTNPNIYKQKKVLIYVLQYHGECDDVPKYNGNDEAADTKQWPERCRIRLFVFDPGGYTYG